MSDKLIHVPIRVGNRDYDVIGHYSSSKRPDRINEYPEPSEFIIDKIMMDGKNITIIVEDLDEMMPTIPGRETIWETIVEKCINKIEE